MNKTVRIAVIIGSMAAAAVAAYRLIPAIRSVAADLRELHLMLEEDDAEAEAEIEQYRVKDPEVLRRIDEALKDHPEGWVTHERPVRKPEREWPANVREDLEVKE